MSLPPSTCPKCHCRLTDATAIGPDTMPEHGDVSFCIQCGNLLVFDKNLRLRPPTLAEHYQFANDARISELEKKVHQMIREINASRAE